MSCLPMTKGENVRLRKLGLLLCLLLLMNGCPVQAANYNDWLVFEDGSSGLYGFIDREGNIGIFLATMSL